MYIYLVNFKHAHLYFNHVPLNSRAAASYGPKSAFKRMKAVFISISSFTKAVFISISSSKEV